jgi:hypothetical protein
VAKLKYLEIILTDENCIHREEMSRLNSENQNLQSSHLPSENVKIKIYKAAILPLVLY